MWLTVVVTMQSTDSVHWRWLSGGLERLLVRGSVLRWVHCLLVLLPSVVPHRHDNRNEDQSCRDCHGLQKGRNCSTVISYFIALHRGNLVVPRTRRRIGDRAFSVAAPRAGTGYRRSWNCCDRRTCFVVIRKHFCFILSTGTRIRIDSVMRPRSSSRGTIKVPQLQLQLQLRQRYTYCQTNHSVIHDSIVNMDSNRIRI